MDASQTSRRVMCRMSGMFGYLTLRRSSRLESAWLRLSCRLLYSRDAAHLLREEVDEQPDSRDSRAFRDDEQIERDGRRRIVRHHDLQPPRREEIAHEPEMRGSDAAPGNESLT